MYAYKRQVAIGLVLTLVNIVVAAAIANADPFGSDLFWDNFLVMAIVPLFAIWAPVTIIGFGDDGNAVMSSLGIALAIFVLGGALLAAMASTWAESAYVAPLVWGVYGANLLTFFISAAVVYLGTPIPNGNVSELRQTA